MYKTRIVYSTLSLIVALTISVESDAAVTWTRNVGTPETSDGGDSRSANFVDYDNDGWLDLFFSNGPQVGEVNFLYHNNGNGTYTRVLNDTIANVARACCATSPTGSEKSTEGLDPICKTTFLACFLKPAASAVTVY